jgi:hypothetical protein
MLTSDMRDTMDKLKKNTVHKPTKLKNKYMEPVDENKEYE